MSGFYVEVAPGYLRLRHRLGLRTKFGRRRLNPLELQVVRALEDLEDAGETIDREGALSGLYLDPQGDLQP